MDEVSLSLPTRSLTLLNAFQEALSYVLSKTIWYDFLKITTSYAKMCPIIGGNADPLMSCHQLFVLLFILILRSLR